MDPRGLLVAGAVIGALGVLDDVTVTQVAAVEELPAGGAEPTDDAWERFSPRSDGWTRWTSCDSSGGRRWVHR